MGGGVLHVALFVAKASLPHFIHRFVLVNLGGYADAIVSIRIMS